MINFELVNKINPLIGNYHYAKEAVKYLSFCGCNEIPEKVQKLLDDYKVVHDEIVAHFISLLPKEKQKEIEGRKVEMWTQHWGDRNNICLSLHIRGMREIKFDIEGNMQTSEWASDVFYNFDK